MKIDILEIQGNDTVLVFLPVGNMPTPQVDKYVEKALKSLKDTFRCEVAIVPAREINQMDFTVVRRV